MPLLNPKLAVWRSRGILTIDNGCIEICLRFFVCCCCKDINMEGLVCIWFSRKTDPGAGRQARAAEGRRSKRSIFQASALAHQWWLAISPSSLYRRINICRITPLTSAEYYCLDRMTVGCQDYRVISKSVSNDSLCWTNSLWQCLLVGHIHELHSHG